MKRTGSTQSPGDVGLLSTITAYELRNLLQMSNLIGFSGLGELAYVELVVVGIGAEVVDIDESSTHCVFPPKYC